MWNKRGELNPRWLGGVTPERQSFYTSKEWKAACSFVWKRDHATCRRCGIHRDESKDIPFHIHHIVSFADKNLRADPSNLVLLCETCHQFVHSKRNTKNEFLSKK
jgi:5-methylcytosine-specific restriction endonuclease McrA